MSHRSLLPVTWLGRRFGQGPALSFILALLGLGCEVGGEVITLPPLPPEEPSSSAPFTCRSEASVRCIGTRHFSCERYDEFIEVVELDCGATGEVCDPERRCITCTPNLQRCAQCAASDAECDPNRVERCTEDGERWVTIESCDLAGGIACFDGACMNMCTRARAQRSYVGCEFYAVDLDNAVIDDRNNAAAQQFAVAVANPHDVPVDVLVEVNDAPYGEPVNTRLLSEVTVAPGSLEVFNLPQREVDGSSEGGLNDGTHTAVTSNAFRLESTHPITAYQFNPLENANVFSNDASLLLPTSAIDRLYTVVGWPQTIGDSDNPAEDFDSTTSDEDLRAFLTIVGTQPDTEITVTLGRATRTIAPGGPIGALGPGERVRLSLGPFDVLNLETDGFNADFTGTVVSASRPVTVFTGSEASDVPRFGTYSTRRCCADHLEEQLIPDGALGNRFAIARMPARARALVDAAAPGQTIDIAIADEPEWVRVLAVSRSTTVLTTTLPEPHDLIELAPGEDVILRADQDFMLEASHAVSVLQALPSQGVTGIPPQYPGGDPSIIVVPPMQQYRRDYIFLTPDKYAFDFVVITAESSARVLLDGTPIEQLCSTSPADGIPRTPAEPPPDWVVHRCQFSFPEVSPGLTATTRPGVQNDGVHSVVSDREVGIVVYGFDRFVSYAYVGGLDLEILQ